MATIKNRKLVHFNSEQYYENSKNSILPTQIVFVGDHENAKGKKIITHGETYYTDFSGENGISVNNGVIKNFTSNILFFSTLDDYNALCIALAGEENADDSNVITIGESKLPEPCVIYIKNIGEVIYVGSDANYNDRSISEDLEIQTINEQEDNNE